MRPWYETLNRERSYSPHAETKNDECPKAINPATRKSRSVRRNTSKPTTRKRVSARKPRKRGLGPPSTNSTAAAKRAAPAGREPIEIMPALTSKQISLHLNAGDR